MKVRRVSTMHLAGLKLPYCFVSYCLAFVSYKMPKIFPIARVQGQAPTTLKYVPGQI